MSPVSTVKFKTKTDGTNPKALARELLGKALGFKNCRAETLDALVAAGNVWVLGKGELVERHGVPSDHVSFLITGSLEISILRRDGHRHLIHFVQPGEILGVIGFLDGQGSVGDACAREAATSVLIMAGDFVRDLRERDPLLIRAFEQQLVYRSRLLHQRLIIDSSLAPEARLARLLLTLSNVHGTEAATGEIKLRVKLSQADLADWLGVSRQRVNFAMQILIKAQVVRSEASTITIFEQKKLLEFANM